MRHTLTLLFVSPVLVLAGSCRGADRPPAPAGSATADAPVSTRPASAPQPGAPQGSAPAPAPIVSARSSGDDGGAAAAVVRAYYDAIQSRDYRRAYGLWEDAGRASGQSFDAFRRGFAETASVELTVGAPGRVEGAAGSRYVDVPVAVTAVQRDGTVRRFRGRYTLRRAVVPGATDAERHWHLYAARVARVD